MADGRHLENRFFFSKLSQRHIVRLKRNFEWRSRITCWQVWRNQI